MRVLAIGAHPDDIELGCGGSLLAHRDAGHKVALLVMTTGERGPSSALSRVREQEESAALLGAELVWGRFKDGSVPHGRRAIQLVDDVVAAIRPDIVYTHSPDDTHQDHRATGRASLAAGRRVRQVLCYESPTSVSFRPDVFVDIGGRVEAKLDLIRCHMSQVLANGLVDLEAVEAGARFRGFTARVRQAEAFTTTRFTWSPACPGHSGGISHRGADADPEWRLIEAPRLPRDLPYTAGIDVEATSPASDE